MTDALKKAEWWQHGDILEHAAMAAAKYAQNPDQPTDSVEMLTEMVAVVLSSLPEALTSAGYTIERGWCDDMSLAETPSPSPLMGSANGVQFLMTWSPGSARLNAAFKDAFGQQAKESPDHPPGWYAWAKGLRCYTLDGKPIQVHPTHWRPITPPNGGE